MGLTVGPLNEESWDWLKKYDGIVISCGTDTERFYQWVVPWQEHLYGSWSIIKAKTTDELSEKERELASSMEYHADELLYLISPRIVRLSKTMNI